MYNRELGIAGSVVMRLMQAYLLKGHHLFVDSWFTSPTLFEESHANSTGACGTVKQNRCGMPRLTDQLEKGDCDYTDTLILYLLSNGSIKGKVPYFRQYMKQDWRTPENFIGKLGHKFENQSRSLTTIKTSVP